MEFQPTPEQLREQKAFEDWRAEERYHLRRAQYRRQVLVCSLTVVCLSSLLTCFSLPQALGSTAAICLPLALCLFLRLDQIPTLCVVAPIIFLVHWPAVFLILMEIVLISFVARFYALRLDL
jgi:hypothetical protein